MTSFSIRIAAVAALYTEEEVFVADTGIFYGREAIENQFGALAGHSARLRLPHSQHLLSAIPSCPMHSDDPKAAPRSLVLLASSGESSPSGPQGLRHVRGQTSWILQMAILGILNLPIAELNSGGRLCDLAQLRL